MISLVAFDMGGVLVFADEQPAIRELSKLSGKSEAQVFEACFSPDRKRPHETGQQGWSEFARVAMHDLELELSEAEFSEARFKDIFCSILVPNQPMLELVEQVSKKHRIALLSNTGPGHWDRAREMMPMAESFDPLITSFEAGVMKPEREIFDLLSRNSGVPHEQIIFIDDLAANIDAARTAGLQAVQFTGIEQLLDDFEQFGLQL